MFEGEENHAMKESWQKKALIRLEALSLRNKDILLPFLSDLLNIADGSANETRDLALTSQQGSWRFVLGPISAQMAGPCSTA